MVIFTSDYRYFLSWKQYSEGYTVFDAGQGIKAVEAQLTNLLSVDGSRSPISGSYWTDTLHYKVYFYDDLLEKNEYTDGSLTGTDSFSYPYSHNDGWTAYNTIITCLTVIVTINAGVGKFRMDFLDNLPDVIRSASHVWEDR